MVLRLVWRLFGKHLEDLVPFMTDVAHNERVIERNTASRKHRRIGEASGG